MELCFLNILEIKSVESEYHSEIIQFLEYGILKQ